MKVLILYASFGGGHLKAAESLREYYRDTYPDFEVMFIDALKYTSPELNTLLTKTYIQLAKNIPKAWGQIYKLADEYSSITDFSTLMNQAIAKKFTNLVLDFNPEIVICTHPFGVDMLATIKKKYSTKYKIGLVLTDYASHALWLTQPEEVDAFFVAHETMATQIELQGISNEKVYPTGIPVLKKFKNNFNKKEILNDLNLNDKFTILFFPGGEYGLSKNKSIFKDLLRLHDIQIIAVTGRNEKLKKLFEKFASHSTKNVSVLGYTDKIAELLHISDIVVTKPGGLTTTESIVSHTPIVILTPVPGQEEHNSNYILNNGLGFRLFENSDKLLTLKSIISNTKRLEQVKEMQTLLAKPDAAKDICETMINISK